MTTAVDNVLRSWSIYQEKNGCVTFKIRFQNTIEEAMHDDVNIQYRRKPTSQVKRDQDRCASWRTTRPQSTAQEAESSVPPGGSRVTRSRSKLLCSDTEQPRSCDSDPPADMPVFDETVCLNPEAQSFCTTPQADSTLLVCCSPSPMETDSRRYDSTVMDLYEHGVIPDCTELGSPKLVQPDLSDSDGYSDVADMSPCQVDMCAYGGGSDTSATLYYCSKCDLYVCQKCCSEGGHVRHKRYLRRDKDIAESDSCIT